MMRSLTSILLFGTAALAAPHGPFIAHRHDNSTIRTGPFTFPLPNGFPSPSPATISTIEQRAHGTLPDSALPTAISDDSVPVLELIAFNELFEVAFFSDLVANITNGVEGYGIENSTIDGKNQQDRVLNILDTILAQEELHALGANAILTTAGHNAVAPCQYSFPVSNFKDAVAFAATFTDVVLGTLQEAIHAFAVDGDVELTTLIASVIGQEGEQEGFFRLSEKPHKVPSALPFLTASSGPFAFSALNQLVVVPQSCPNSSAINIPIFSPLVVDEVDLCSSVAHFSYAGTNSTAASSLSLVYINQQNLPIVEQMQNMTNANGVVTFSAALPANLSGLAIAAITKNAGPFANASEVAAATIYGPGLLELA